jgi:ubiquinone/menaquinone biosynthesis C-methylase UbiE
MAIRIILIVLGALLAYLILIRIVRKLWHFPAPAFIGLALDSNVRRLLQPPSLLVQRSGIKSGMNVLEIGCGSGAFTTYSARAVGKTGRVYALDIQPGMLKQLQRKLSRPENRDIVNVEPFAGNAYTIPFHDNSLDLVYMVTVLQEIPDRRRVLIEAGRVLKPGGILAVTEFFPDPDYPWKSTTTRIGEDAGFLLDQISGNFWNYTTRFTKTDTPILQNMKC